MTSIQTLKEIGVSMGLKDAALQAFIKEQQAEERAQRNLERQQEIEKLKIQQEKEKMEWQLQSEKEKREAELLSEERKLQSEREQRDRDMEKTRQEFELKKLALERQSNVHEDDASSTHSSSHGSPRPSRPQGPKLPYFDDGKDDMDAYLFRFEKVAGINGWKKEDWAIYLSSLLKGKALEVYSRLSTDQISDYDALKKALLRRYELTDEGFKIKFRSAKPEKGESPESFMVRLQSYLQRWIELSGTEQTFEGVTAMLVMDQYLNICSREMSLFIKERAPADLSELSELAQQYLDAHGDRGHAAKPRAEFNIYNNGSQTSSLKKCFKCGRAGHISKECRSGTGETQTWAGSVSRAPSHTTSTFPKSGKNGCWNCGKPGHISRNCMQPTKAGAMTVEELDQSKEEEDVCGALETGNHKDCEIKGCNGQHGVECKMSCGCMFPVIVDACHTPVNCQVKMPVVEGFVGNRKVSVLRDTGCSMVVVRRSLEEDCQMIGSEQRCVLIDETVRIYPVAEIDITSPYYSGRIKALCMKEPLYDVIIGNVDGARDIADKIEDQAAAVVTRSQVHKPATKRLIVSDLGMDDISVEDMKRMQQEDDSLKRVWNRQNENTDGDKGRAIQFVEKKGLWYRRTNNKNAEFTQLLVPTRLRQKVLTLAHEGIMSGHQATRRTVDRILSAFWWPGLHADATRFCRSCDICQRTTPAGRISKVPLGEVPIIQTPFQRVAIDLIGPMSPVTDRGHRYVLTVVDYATRYPEAEVLKDVETVTVAEALVTIFSRVGVPAEVLSDQGGQFVGKVMTEVSRLLLIKRLVTTPYHPQCNGLVERFNGTLKAMLKKVAAERPRDWDRYIPALLFAYREVPQESLGFSPFEMLYGRTVRGPLQILKELWTKDIESDEVKSTYRYVLDLKERLQETCELAHQNLKEAQRIQKKYFDAKARDRVFKPGEKVFLLLPTENSKLLMHWQGPFEVLERSGLCDYKIQLPNRVRTFHANMLKKYWEKDTDKQEELQQGADIATACAVVLEPIDREDDEDIPLDTINAQQVETYVDVIVNPDLTSDQQSQIKNLLYKYRDIFTDVPKVTNLGRHDIKLVSADPIKGKAYPLPHAMKPVLEEELNMMVKMDVIEPSTAAYASPVVLVKKADGSTRVCIDYRRLNRITVFDPEPIPHVDAIFAKLAGDRYFSKFDLCKGYWQIPMNEEDKDLTTFVCHRGLYRFKVMPFGLVNAPATFTRIMRKLLEDTGGLDNYLDDILAHSKVWEGHLKCLEVLFDRVRKANLALKPSKCVVGEFDVSFLGFQIGEGTMKPKTDTVSRILDAPRPTTKKQVRAFLGLVGFYRKFVPNFAALAVPLTDLTKKGAKSEIDWGEKQQRSFDALKACIANPPILKLPDVNKPFVLQTDASNVGIGAVMLQEGEDGIKHPVAFASRKLLPREINYSTIEKECLAIVWAIGKFQQYLYGTEFVLETDHQPLQYLGAAQFQNGRLMRWALTLQPYRFMVKAVRGKDNVGADFLSRHPC